MKKIFIFDIALVICAFWVIGFLGYEIYRGISWLVIHWTHPGML